MFCVGGVLLCCVPCTVPVFRFFLFSVSSDWIFALNFSRRLQPVPSADQPGTVGADRPNKQRAALSQWQRFCPQQSAVAVTTITVVVVVAADAAAAAARNAIAVSWPYKQRFQPKQRSAVEDDVASWCRRGCAVLLLYCAERKRTKSSRIKLQKQRQQSRRNCGKAASRREAASKSGNS